MDIFVSIIYAICGLSYVILAGKGKYICFIFGIISSILYAILSFKNSLWGSFLLSCFCYLPIETISLYKWIKHTNPETKSVSKVKLGKVKFSIYLVICLILSGILSYFLYVNSDKSPILDSIVTIFSILGSYLTMKRTQEQWIVWTIVNISTIIVWLMLSKENSGSVAIIILWLTYLFFGIKYYFDWKKEVKFNQK